MKKGYIIWIIVCFLVFGAFSVSGLVGHPASQIFEGVFQGNFTIDGILNVTGNIIASEPTANSHVATKSYVDANAGGSVSKTFEGLTLESYPFNFSEKSDADAICNAEYPGSSVCKRTDIIRSKVTSLDNDAVVYDDVIYERLFEGLLIDDSINYAYDLDIAVGNDGNPVIVYEDRGEEDLIFYKCNDPMCTSGTRRNLGYSEHSSTLDVEIGADGNPVIAYKRNTWLAVYKCDNVDCSSGSYRNVYSNTGAYSYISLAIGSDNNPVISYYDDDSDDLNIYKCNDSSCSGGIQRRLDYSTSNIGQYTSIAIGSDGYPIISYKDATGRDLEFYKCEDINCSSGIQRTLDTNIYNGGESSIAIGNDGYPIISYVYEGYYDYQDEIYFYKCDDLSCSSGSSRILDTDTLNDVSMLIDSSGNPIIAYGQKGRLKVYRCNDSLCSGGSSNIVDSVNFGHYTSIAMGNDEIPIIGYTNIVSDKVMFTKAYKDIKYSEIDKEGFVKSPDQKNCRFACCS